MRLIVTKVYRAFPPLDGLSDDECMTYVRRVCANYTSLQALTPFVFGGMLLFTIPIAWMALEYHGWERYWPLITTFELRLVLMVLASVAIAAIGGLFMRDVVMYLALRTELNRASCRKCGHCLLGLPTTLIGLEPDPAKTYIRCPECGKQYCMLDLGLSARDLTPFEQRVAAPDIGKIKRPY